MVYRKPQSIIQQGIHTKFLTMNVCYLSSSQLGEEMYTFLKSQNANISFSNTANNRVNNFDNIEYDLGISFLYTHKIPSSEFLKKKLWINFHPGPLPDYRGRNLCYHALMNGADKFGATLHYMNEEYDTGDIIEVQTFPIESHYTAGDLSKLSKNILVSLFKKYVPLFLEGKTIEGEKQSQQGVCYKKTIINEEINLSLQDQTKIRALTVCPHFYPHIIVNGKKYFIIPEQDKSCKHDNRNKL